MINDILFSKSFLFRSFNFKKYKYTDNRAGIKIHYFLYMESGKGRIVTDDKTLYINEGEAFYFPKGLSYQSYWYGTPKVRFISLGFAYMPKNEGEFFDIQSISCSDEEIRLFKDISSAKDVGAKEIGKLYTLVGMLMPKMALYKSGKGHQVIEAVKKRLDASPHTPVSELARLAAVSQSLLYHLFKTHSEVSINDYRRIVLMNRAKEMLISTDTSIEDISEKLAFSSGAYFRKTFKEHFGMSPREMRKKANSFS